MSEANQTAAEITSIHARLDAGDERMARIETAVQANAASSAELVELFTAFKGAFKVFEYIGKLAKPLGAIIGLGVAVAGAWTLFKTGAGR